MKMRRNKGGAPTKEKTALWEQLHKTRLFNRSSFTYVNMEKALDELSPARAFEMFSRLCMIRDSKYIHELKQTISYTIEEKKYFLRKIDEDRILHNLHPINYKFNLDFPKKHNQKEVTLNTIIEPSADSECHLINSDTEIRQLKELSFEVYGIYLILSGSNSIANLLNAGKGFTSDDDLNFSIRSEIKLKHIFDEYSKESQRDIFAVCLDKELYENREFKELFEEMDGFTKAKELIFSILKEHYLIDLNLLKNPDNLFYLPSFDTENHKAFITKTVEEDMATYSTTTIHSGKNIYLRVNPDKPLEHYQEMFKLLQLDLDINTDLHSKTFNKVLAHNTSQKSIAGKMTDLLYIYDNHLYGYSIAWTIDEITSYGRETKPKYWESKTIMSRSTYSTYKKIIDNFIGNKRYKL